MGNLLCLLYDINPNVLYIGIGTEPCREDIPENEQIFPPFLEEMSKTNSTLVVNIDMAWGDLPKIFNKYTGKYPDLVLSEPFPGVFMLSRENLTFVFITETISIIKGHYNEPIHASIFDEINRYSMNQGNMLFCSSYTGIDNREIEKHFLDLYKGTEYEEKYCMCHYGYITDESSCLVDVTTNVPVLNDTKTSIVKFHGTLNELQQLHDMYHEQPEFMRALRREILIRLKRMVDCDIVVYRQHVLGIEALHFDATIWDHFDMSSPEKIYHMMSFLSEKMSEYDSLVERCYGTDNMSQWKTIISNIVTPGDTVATKHVYPWVQSVNKFLFKIRQELML